MFILTSILTFNGTSSPPLYHLSVILYYHSFYYLFFLQTYIHKETHFRCRSLEEIKNYEKYGSLPRCHKVKIQDKEESNDKTRSEKEVSILILKNK